MNMGKIVNALKWMKISVLNRQKEPEVQTIQDFSDSMGILRAAKMQWFWRLQETALSWKYVSKLSSDAK
jgi:hypothetical protein